MKQWIVTILILLTGCSSHSILTTGPKLQKYDDRTEYAIIQETPKMYKAYISYQAPDKAKKIDNQYMMNLACQKKTRTVILDKFEPKNFISRITDFKLSDSNSKCYAQIELELFTDE